MTSEDLRSQLDRVPFLPLRLHLVSGSTYEIRNPANVTLLQNTLMIIQDRDPRFNEEGYDVIAFRNIERIEQIRSNRSPSV